MVELLALSPVTKIDEISKQVPPPASGLPINALPGWDRIPLCNKLPMLDAPTNEIIFSREKMGKRLWKPSEFVLYDPNCYMVKLDYDPLHDPHLKNFYSRPANFKIIKDIGRVTDDKDVICTLKEFNDYRQYIRRLHIDLINNEIKRKERAHEDIFLLQIAEEVAYKQIDYEKTPITRSPSEIFRIRQSLDRQRMEKARQSVNNTKRIFDKIERMKQLRMEKCQENLQYRAQLIQNRIKRVHDDEKSRIIALKKKFLSRDVRQSKFLKHRKDTLYDLKSLKAQANWQKRIDFRAWRQDRNKELRFVAHLMKNDSIERHKQLMRIKWDHIQMHITEKAIQRRQRDEMAKMMRKKLKKHKKLKKQKKKKVFVKSVEAHTPVESIHRRSSLRKIDRTSLAPLLDLPRHSQQEIQDAISTAISFHNLPTNDKISTEKILSSAKYILEKVLKSVNRNLGQDYQAREYMYQRIGELFLRVKKHVLLKVERVLQASDEVASCRSSEIGVTKSRPISSSFMLPLWSKSLANTMSKAVSFGEIEPIGKTAQEIDSDVELRSVKSRTPTPASSLTSVNAMFKETCTPEDVQIPIKSHEQPSYKIPHWTANERIFVEHFYIKFKKSLLVGVERAVFDAIDLKKREFRLTTRREILELDRKYLTNIMAESILTYNLNSYNYYGNTRLCVSVLAAECLFDLQNSQLTPKFDPAYRVEPRCRCNNGAYGTTCDRKSGAFDFI